MKTINLVYWNEVANIGDILSPYIVQCLSGMAIRHKSLHRVGRKRQIRYLLDFLLRRISLDELMDIRFSGEVNLLCIGSILSRSNRSSVIWGSGFMNKNESFNGGKVFAVRGRLSNEKLLKEGNSGCSVYGDPALLLPLFVPPVLDKKYDVALIPHWSEYDYFQKAYGDTYKVINVQTTNVEGFVNELTACHYILSSSLHGIILAHAYNIPALWISHGYIETDGFKFHDYFSSVDIPMYNGIKNFTLLLRTGDWKQLFADYSDLALPHKDIGEIQMDLIRVAPFKVRNRAFYLNHGC